MKRPLLALLTACVLFSCGRKAPPFLPIPVSPGALNISDVVSEGDRVRITVRVPRERFSLKREEEPWYLARMLRAKAGAERPSFEERVVTDSESGFGFGQRLTLIDTDVTPGDSYLYRLELRKKDSKEWVATETIPVEALRVPGMPRDLRVEGREDVILVSWTSPEGGEQGVEYRVLRRPGKNGEEALVREALVSTTYTDRGIEGEREYCYRVVAVRRSGSAQAEGIATPEICGRTEDRTPPPPPSMLAAVIVDGGVRLTWLPLRSEEVRGYNVYRARGAGPFVRVNEEPLRSARYLDASADRGERLSYRVTAVDVSRRSNESLFSETVSVSVPP